jgi:predicted permease
VSGLVALIVGLVPALRLAAGDPARELRSGGRWDTGGRRGRLRQGLVAVEVALSFVLLLGGALMVRSMGNLLGADTGLDTDGVLTMYVPLPRAGYPTVEDRARFYDEVLAGVRDLPGVVSAGAGDPLPLTGYNRQWHLSGEGLETVGSEGLRTDQSSVTPGYFASMGIPVIAGRAFDRDDGPDDPVAVIDQTLAERLWPGKSALGRTVRFTGDGPRVRIVGVVGHVHHYGVRIEGRGQIYLPHHLRVFGLSLVIRAPGAVTSLLPRVRRIVAGVDPDVPLDRVRTMESYRRESLAAELLATRVLSGFGIAALVLAVFGLYGVVSYTVSQRTREIGIRMAMGAPLGGVVASITRSGLAMAAVGVLLGVGAAVLATPVLRSLLFGVGPQDPLAMALIAGVLLGVSALAALIPALRAGRVDPARTLRE